MTARVEAERAIADVLLELDVKFQARYEVRDNGCWEWLPAPKRRYGNFWIGEPVPALAHRWSYERFVGPISDGLTIDHLCKNTRCVNPQHLEPVTQAENSHRHHQLTTHCPEGHPYDEENTYVYQGKRSCKECRRIRVRNRPPRQRDRSYVCEVCGQKRTTDRKRHMATHRPDPKDTRDE